jgi:cytochrome c oxidase subunit II
LNLLKAAFGSLLSGRLLQDDATFWMPRAASTTAHEVDSLFYWIFWIALFFFALIVILGTLFVFKYRARRRSETAAAGPVHNTPLEVVWTVIPLLIVFGIFYVGFRGFLDMNVAPENSYEIQVTAQKWKWLFTYPNGYVDDNLHVPVDTPVKLVMASEDVIHSFYVPDFRLKKDVVPGRYTKAWFRAPRPGTYQVYCAEYCGTSHSDMLASVIVHEPGGFEKWLEGAASSLAQASPADAGARLVKQRGCAQCHSIDGKAGIGPTFKGLFGTKVPMKTGESVDADENYIRESINAPQAKIVAGFDPVMPTYQGRLKDDEITAIIAYLKSLKD